MEILQLRYFYDSAKYESFAKTAKKYSVPTTAVSASIKRLENELGVKLFDRLSNRVLLNDSGKKLQQSLNIILGELDEISAALSSPENDTREIKMLVKCMRAKITDYIIEYKSKHPHIAFKTVFDFSEINIDDYDIIIDDSPEKYANYEKIELLSMRLLFKASKKSPLCDRTLTLKQLQNQSFLSMGEDGSMQKTLTTVCNKAGFSPDIVLLSNDTQCYKKCLEAGIGIGLGRYDPKESNPEIEYLNVVDFDVRQTVYAFFKKQYDSKNIKHFTEFLKKKSIY